MIYAGKLIVNSAGKLRARIELGDATHDLKILKGALKQFKSQFMEITTVQHDAFFHIEVNKRDEKVAIPAGIRIKQEIIAGNKVLETLLEGLEEVKPEEEKEDLAESFEEFSQENWTSFIEALKKTFGPTHGSKLPGYAAFEKFCRENYYGPANKKSMS